MCKTQGYPHLIVADAAKDGASPVTEEADHQVNTLSGLVCGSCLQAIVAEGWILQKESMCFCRMLRCKLTLGDYHWQNTKVHFYVMRSASVEGFSGGATQIENILCHEVGIRRKDLLPVYEQYNSIKLGWNDRFVAFEYYVHEPIGVSRQLGPTFGVILDQTFFPPHRAYNVRRHNSGSSLDSGQSRENTTDESVICPLKSKSVSSTESSDGVI
ncbi:ATG18-like protein [Artemisia annua]|uniref:ATG18-like protein n=1 Tax=Artemisia annua TaxID=35608 RepID=A0A2U1NYY5_ARTAN|nr:ATG18-like protein [Artemisia annua]